ncbi:MAG: YbhB/YbcL family Raf kinase inhibitor-like protein [Nanoarchaeota archaeon]|nr:YbhB/YbcL family Raf kinase inhibitor-like protein [Nanoarchaeota archaeon]
MKLESNFEHNSDMPRELTCQGEDLSPHLKWSGVPKETKSFALRIFDPDAPGDGWVHWQVYNIPRASTGFEKGTYEGSQVPNDFGKEDYGGPCPPSGKHKYVHTLYALDVEELEDVTKDNFLEKIGAHTIDKAELIGLYEKS